VTFRSCRLSLLSHVFDIRDDCLVLSVNLARNLESTAGLPKQRRYFVPRVPHRETTLLV